MRSEEDRRKLEDAIDAADRARTRVEIAGMQLAAMGLKDHEAVARLKTAASVLREARLSLLALRTA